MVSAEAPVKRSIGSMKTYAAAEVMRAKKMRRTKPLPRILSARSLSPCPNAIAARGAPPPLTIAENAEIRMITDPVTPTPASASVPIPGIWPM